MYTYGIPYHVCMYIHIISHTYHKPHVRHKLYVYQLYIYNHIYICVYCDIYKYKNQVCVIRCVVCVPSSVCCAAIVLVLVGRTTAPAPPT